MIALTLDRIAKITRSRLRGSAQPTDTVDGPVVIDSREAAPGSLFVALRGSRVDGHDFAEAAVRAGATAVLCSRPVDAPHLLVDGGDDAVVAALAKLARAVVAELPDADIIGVTGSSGKTTTKDLLAQTLQRIGPTVAPPGSFNNEIGHPLTVLRADQTTRFIALEVAARGVGHIAHLCQIAPPRIGVVLNVGSAHMGEFGSRDTIAQAKGELVEALPAAAQGGVAVLNADDDAVIGMASRTAARVVSYGLAPDADVRAEGIALDERGRPRFTLAIGEDTAPVSLRLVEPVTAVAAALSEAGPVSRWRMEVTERPDGVTIVNDAYNANPESMSAALRTLATLASGRRAFAVLGHMAELGSAHRTEHERIGRLVTESGVDVLITVGEQAASIADGAASVADWKGETVTVADVTEAVAVLKERLRPKDIVMLKGSRVAGLEQVAEQLIDVEAAE